MKFRNVKDYYYHYYFNVNYRFEASSLAEITRHGGAKNNRTPKKTSLEDQKRYN